jgi:cyclopropane fatty-acyl-phospholipid synthase-like methyltransferase
MPFPEDLFPHSPTEGPPVPRILPGWPTTPEDIEKAVYHYHEGMQRSVNRFQESIERATARYRERLYAMMEKGPKLPPSPF